MRFRNVNGALIAADQDSSNFMVDNMTVEFLDLFALKDLRTPLQNKKMWPMLNDFATQIEWAGEYREPEDWKYILSAAFEKTRLIPGIDGEIVPIPASTSRYTKKKFAEFIELMYATGEELGVKWSDPSIKFYEEMMQEIKDMGFNSPYAP